MATATRRTHLRLTRRGRRATRAAHPDPGASHLTLLELVETVGEITDDDAEVVATVMHMLRTGTVKLRGNFRDEPINKLC